MATELTAMQLKEAFDLTFARPVQAEDGHMQDYLLIKVDGRSHALPLADTASLMPIGWITPMPSGVKALRGIASYKDRLLPAYDLRELLGYPSTHAPRWQVRTRDTNLLLVFDNFIRHLRCGSDALKRLSADVEQHPCVEAWLTWDSARWPVLRMASLVQRIRTLCARAHE